jgi:glutathione-specific gamma-glutamylcyclotransferase
VAPALDQDVWLFGYGSLMWRPDVPFAERAPAVLPGYVRRFWQRSTDHRGDPERPGRVVTLVPGSAKTLGVAYRLVDPEPTLTQVDVREQQGYDRRVLPINLADGRTVAAVVYVADPANPYFVAEEPLAETARVVATARGPSGANLEYARCLASTLEQLLTHGSRERGRAPGLARPGELDIEYERQVLALAEAFAAAAR